MRLELRKDKKKVSLIVDGLNTSFINDDPGKRLFTILAAKIGKFMKCKGEGSLVVKIDGILSVKRGVESGG